MKKGKIPANEFERLNSLYGYHILDTSEEQSFDDLTELAASICGTPIALVSLVDKDRQWFKSHFGLNARETPRDVAFCAHAINQTEIFIVEDAIKDERFVDNPLVTGAPHVRFYAGAQLTTPGGFNIGTLCVIDHKPRVMNPDQLRALRAIARQVINQFERIETERNLRRTLTELQLAKETAVKADESKSNFLYTMSHEIRTPLNGIIGMTSLLQETQLTADQQEYSETISQSSKTLLTIINDILDFSKIEAGKMELEESDFDLGDYVKDLLKPFHFAVKKKNIVLSFESKTPLLRVCGDSGRIGQVISNLVSNAVKFTKTGGVNVGIEMRPVDQWIQVVLTVRDSGVGIPIEAQSKMFQAFSQAERSTSRNFGGTGLGLSISKRLVDLMGGTIGFESKEGVGTVFRVELSLKPAIAAISKEHLSQVVNLQKHSTTFAGRILVAEDNSTNQIVISRMLDKFGCKYHVVADGNEVLDAMREAPYDLILMDCQMPEMDGYTATRLIRNSGTLNSKIAIVALTANVVQGDEVKCREAGMNDYLAKPIDRRKLEEILGRYLMNSTKINKRHLIDMDALVQFDDLQIEGEPDILIEIIDSFLRTSPKRIEIITSCVKVNDVVGAAREAHALKSGAMTLGAKLLGEFCQKIEDRRESKNLEGLSQLSESLQRTYDQSCIELKDVRSEQENRNLKKVS